MIRNWLNAFVRSIGLDWFGVDGLKSKTDDKLGRWGVTAADEELFLSCRLWDRVKVVGGPLDGVIFVVDKICLGTEIGGCIESILIDNYGPYEPDKYLKFECYGEQRMALHPRYYKEWRLNIHIADLRQCTIQRLTEPPPTLCLRGAMWLEMRKLQSEEEA